MTNSMNLSATEIAGSFAMIRFDCDLCENTRTSDELSVELRGQLISKGTDKIKVHVFDKKEAKILRTLRERLRRYLMDTCIKYGDNVFLVKREKVADILAKCDKVIQEFNNALSDIYNRYAVILDNHLNTLDGDLYTVAKALCYSPSEWQKRNTLNMAPVMLMQGLSEEDDERLVDEISDASLDDIKTSVNAIYRELFVEPKTGALRNSTTTTAIKKLNALSDKVGEIAMVSEGLGNISGYMKQVIASVPQPTGDKGVAIEGHGFSMLLNLIMLLKDRDLLKACADDARNFPVLNQDEEWFLDDEPESNAVIASNIAQATGNVVTPSTQVEPFMDDMFASADEFQFE